MKTRTWSRSSPAVGPQRHWQRRGHTGRPDPAPGPAAGTWQGRGGARCTDAAQRPLTQADLAVIVRREAGERETAADQCDQGGHPTGPNRSGARRAFCGPSWRRGDGGRGPHHRYEISLTWTGNRAPAPVATGRTAAATTSTPKASADCRQLRPAFHGDRTAGTRTGADRRAVPVPPAVLPARVRLGGRDRDLLYRRRTRHHGRNWRRGGRFTRSCFGPVTVSQASMVEAALRLHGKPAPSASSPARSISRSGTSRRHRRASSRPPERSMTTVRPSAAKSGRRRAAARLRRVHRGYRPLVAIAELSVYGAAPRSRWRRGDRGAVARRAQRPVGTITRWAPPFALAFTWHPASCRTRQPRRGHVHRDRRADLVTLIHSGWETFDDPAAARAEYDQAGRWCSPGTPSRCRTPSPDGDQAGLGLVGAGTQARC